MRGIYFLLEALERLSLMLEKAVHAWREGYEGKCARQGMQLCSPSCCCRDGWGVGGHVLQRVLVAAPAPAASTCEIPRCDSLLMCTWHLLYLCQARAGSWSSRGVAEQGLKLLPSTGLGCEGEENTL